MRRSLIITAIAFLLGLSIATGLFAFDYASSVSKDAALEAYVRTGNSVPLPPNSLEQRMNNSARTGTLVWEFFTLVWLRQRSELLLSILFTLFAISLCINWLCDRRSKVKPGKT